jgi:hypothetical protein
MFKSKQPIDLQRALTIEQFCYAENISAYTYHRLQKLGWGPVETRIPGTDVIRISVEERAAWHKRLASREAQERLRKERERRAVLQKRKGDLAAQSPTHISNIQKRKRAAKLQAAE